MHTEVVAGIHMVAPHLMSFNSVCRLNGATASQLQQPYTMDMVRIPGISNRKASSAALPG